MYYRQSRANSNLEASSTMFQSKSIDATRPPAPNYGFLSMSSEKVFLNLSRKSYQEFWGSFFCNSIVLIFWDL